MKIAKADVVRKIQCPKCASKGEDRSRDNLVIYLNEDGSESAFCFKCEYKVLSADYKKKYLQEEKEIEFVATDYSQDDWMKDLVKYNTDPKGFRGLSKSTCLKYRVKHEYDEKTGEVVKQFYPVTKDYTFSGIKKRIVLEDDKKTFASDGTVSKYCDLFGENIFKDSHHTVHKDYSTIVLTSGELDAMSVYQMLNDNQTSRNKQNGTEYETTPVVSGVVGESGNVNQYRNRYDYLLKYKKIVYVPDQDEAGEAALHKLGQALPKDRLFIVRLPSGFKDPNEMLMKGEQDQFMKCFWNSSSYNPAGIVGSSSLKELMKQDLLTPKVPLPPFMYEAEEMLAGGFKVEAIINIGAASGCFSHDTEFLSPIGWTPFSEYKEGTKVAQFNPQTLKSEFVDPNEYIVEVCDTLYSFNTVNTSHIVSSDHSLLHANQDTSFGRMMLKEWMEAPTDLLIPYLNEYDELSFDILSKDTIVKEVSSTTGFKYCFSVPSEALIVRHNGKIFISGNCGKSTLVNEMLYYWFFNAPYKVGVVSLELSAPQYGVALGSRHLGKKLALYKDAQEAIAFLELPENDKKLTELYKTEEGLDRFHLVDERDGGIKAIQDLVERLIISCDCRIIVLDPLQDVMAGLALNDQEEFLAWMKSMIKRYSVIFININHVRKSGNGEKANSEGAMISEEDFQGTSSIFKSASVYILFTRNKMLENDNPNKNVVNCYMSKNRNTGLTGNCGSFYYDNPTHTLYDLETYKTQINPALFDAWEAKQELEANQQEKAKPKYSKEY